MKRFLLWPLLLTSIFSCTLQKRLYRPGFATFHKMGKTKAEHIPFHKAYGAFSSQTYAVKKDVAQAADANASIAKHAKVSPKTSHSLFSPTKKKFIPSLAIERPSRTFYPTVIPNGVPKAGLRMFIVGSVFFSGALFCFLNFHELVYVTAALFIIAFVFILVSLISSSAARKDNINNSKGWLATSLVTILLDILEMAGIIIFFIALF